MLWLKGLVERSLFDRAEVDADRVYNIRLDVLNGVHGRFSVHAYLMFTTSVAVLSASRSTKARKPGFIFAMQGLVRSLRESIFRTC